MSISWGMQKSQGKSCAQANSTSQVNQIRENDHLVTNKTIATNVVACFYRFIQDLNSRLSTKIKLIPIFL